MTQHKQLAKELREVHNGHADEGPSTFSEAADALEAQAREMAALKEQVEGLLKDAERLDFVEATAWHPNPAHHYGNLRCNFDLPAIDGVQATALRPVLDAAMAAKGGSDG